LPLRVCFFSAVITELAMPSLATITALRSLCELSIDSNVVPAAWLSQSAIHWSSTFFQPGCLDSTPS
jgi:hypothetical protein